MLDRLTNLLVLFTIAAALVAVTVCLSSAWNSTNPWDEEWIAKDKSHPTHPPGQLLDAMRKATEAYAYDDGKAFKTALEADYQPSGRVLTRFTREEIYSSLLALIVALLFNVIPLSLNYVRHGRFRLWNRGRVD